MTISKTAREFIKEKVYEKTPKPEKLIVCEEEDELARKLEKEIEEKTIEFKHKLRREYSENYGLPIFKGLRGGLTSNIDYAEALKLREEWEQICEKKITEIIVELELGGTKADLDRLLNEIH